MSDWNLELFVSTPTGNIPLTDRIAELPLPRDPDSDAPILRYGPYLEAVAGFFKDEEWHHFFDAMHTFLGRPVVPAEVRRISLISEKHGALYQVARLCVVLPDSTVSFAINVAGNAAQKAFLETEFALLQDLHHRFGLPYLPRPVLQGEMFYKASPGEQHAMNLFLGEWFDGFCEFHLSRQSGAANGFGIRVWDNHGGERFLSDGEGRILYREIATILTGYFDTGSFEQIYPWHHAAGDFIVNTAPGGLKVRMVTARGYRSLGNLTQSDGSVVNAALHFLLNMSLRMRLDRLDGTGELVWADGNCLRGILGGFVQAWEAKHLQDKELPSPKHLLVLLNQFTREDWLSFGELVLEDGMVERDETSTLAEHLENHVVELAKFIRGMID